MDNFYLNKKCMEEIAKRLILTDERIKNESRALKIPEKPTLAPRPSFATSMATENILNEKRICLEKIQTELHQSKLSPEIQKQINNECKRIIQPQNINDVGENVQKFISKQPRLVNNPETNQRLIEDWANKLEAKSKIQEQEISKPSSIGPPPIAPPITDKFNDKASPSKDNSNKKKDREIDD